ITRPSSIAAVAQPETTIPTCSTLQLLSPIALPTCSDHFQPGSYVARPIVIPPMLTTSNLPFSNTRVSSGFSNRLRITSIMIAWAPHPYGRRLAIGWELLPLVVGLFQKLPIFPAQLRRIHQIRTVCQRLL